MFSVRLTASTNYYKICYVFLCFFLGPTAPIFNSVHMDSNNIADHSLPDSGFDSMGPGPESLEHPASSKSLVSNQHHDGK